MSQECEKLTMCGFFKKYGEVKDLACRGFINQYCKGDKMNECKRKEYSKKHGQAPSDEMMPTGHSPPGIRFSYNIINLHPWAVGVAIDVGPANDKSTDFVF